MGEQEGNFAAPWHLAEAMASRVCAVAADVSISCSDAAVTQAKSVESHLSGLAGRLGMPRMCSRMTSRSDEKVSN